MKVAVIALGLVAAFAACSSDPAPTAVVTTASGPTTAAGLTPAAAPDPALLAIRATAHRVMSARCGECHESHRPTAKPAALAIFDLDRPDWPDRFDDHRFTAGLVRFGTEPSPDRDAFVAFRDAELARRDR